MFTKKKLFDSIILFQVFWHLSKESLVFLEKITYALPIKSIIARITRLDVFHLSKDAFKVIVPPLMESKQKTSLTFELGIKKEGHS